MSWKKPAGFLIVEQLVSISEDLELAGRAIADLDLKSPLGGSFAQAHGRAAKVESEQTALNFDHP